MTTADRSADDDVAGESEAGDSRGLSLFVLGTLFGGIAGIIAGTLLSDRTRSLLLGLIELTGRPLSEQERERLRFEMLAQ